VWNLTGGLRGGSFVTDPSNASRTMLYDVASMTWSEELAERFAVPLRALPEVVASSGRIGLVSRELAPASHPLHGVAVGGIAGDQQAALFGQACFEPGMAKATYGTGAFVLVNAGDAPPSPREGLLGTVAWDLGTKGGVAYALEGSVFQAGGTIQWLRDGLGVIEEASEVGPLAASLDGNDGVYLVPAFSGLGSPWWDPYARSLVVGLTRGTGRAHLARAALEAIAYQTRDVLDAMSTAGAPLLRTLRVDGGVAVVDLLLQIQADQAQVQVARPRTSETTALGAAMLAGLGVGLWSSLEEVSALWRQDASFEPKVSKEEADARHAEWLRALERSRAWAS
jgi:glycerol kinase